jgi:hypothetical protein
VLPATLFVNVGGVNADTLPTDTLPFTVNWLVFHVTNCPGVCDTMLNAPE